MSHEPDRDREMMLDLLKAIHESTTIVTPVRRWAERYGVDLGLSRNQGVIERAIEMTIARVERSD